MRDPLGRRVRCMIQDRNHCDCVRAKVHRRRRNIRPLALRDCLLSFDALVDRQEWADSRVQERRKAGECGSGSLVVSALHDGICGGQRLGRPASS